MGKAIWRQPQPRLLVSVRCGCARDPMPGMDGHDPQPGPERRDHALAGAKEPAIRRFFAWDCYRALPPDVRTWSWASPEACRRRLHDPFESTIGPAQKRGAAESRDLDLDVGRLQNWLRASRPDRRTQRRPLPRTARPLWGAIGARSSAPWTMTGPSVFGRKSTIPHK